MEDQNSRFNNLLSAGDNISGTVPMRAVIESLFRRKYLIGVLLPILATYTVVSLHLRPSAYESTMTFLVKNDRADVVITPGQTMGISDRNWIDETQVATDVQLLSSDDIFRYVVQKLNLAGTFEGRDRSPSAVAIDNAVRDLRKEVTISPVLKANMIKVSYESDDPKLAYTVLRTMADAYLDRDLRVHSTSGTYNFFHSQALLYEQRLKEAQGQLAQYQKPRKIVLLGQQKDLTLRKLVELQATLRDTQSLHNEAAERAHKIQHQIAGLSARVVTQSRKIPNQNSIEHLTALITELQNKRTEMLAKFRPTDRMVQQLEQQLANTRQALEAAQGTSATEEASDLNPLRQTLEAELAKTQAADVGLRARVQTITKQVRQYQSELASLEAATPADDELLRRIKDAEENYFLYSRNRKKRG